MNIATSQNKALQGCKQIPKRYNSVEEIDVIPRHKVAKSIKGRIYVTLAEERPTIHYDSEDLTYGDLRARETDECHETSDNDAYGSDTMEVVEYDMASCTDNEKYYSNDSSSGTDDFVVAPVERAMFNTTSTEKNDLCFLADIEDSDGPTDIELARADFRTCVKCKNRQNNPMYRYCEKCYQIRKIQFPTRPKLRKIRSEFKKNLPAGRRALAYSSDEKDCSGKVQGSPNSKKKKRYSRTRKTNKTNSLGDTVTSSTADDNDSDDLVKKGESASKDFKIKNELLKKVDDVEPTLQLKLNPSTQLNLSNPPANVHKDSGFSSCCSNQELSSDLAPVKIFASTSASASGIRSLPSCSGPSKNVENVPAHVVKRPAYSETDEPQSDPIKIFGRDLHKPCVTCLSHRKDGAFVHSRYLHLCCCYRCAVKIWNTRKRCPICNCKVNNVKKIFVH